MPPLRHNARHNQRPVNAAAASTPMGKALSPASLALDTGHLNESTTQSSLPQILDPQPTAPLSDPSKHVVATTQFSSLTNPQRAAEINDLFMLVDQAGKGKRDTDFWQAIADGLVEREWRRKTPKSVQNLYYEEMRRNGKWNRTRKQPDYEIKPWSPEEIDKLFEQLARHASRDDKWDLVAADLVSANFPRRTPQALKRKYQHEKRLRPTISLPRGPPKKFFKTGALLETTNIVGGTGTSSPPLLGFTNDSIGPPPRPRTGRRPSLLVGQQAELSEDSAAARSPRPVYKNDEELIGPPPRPRTGRRPSLLVGQQAELSEDSAAARSSRRPRTGRRPSLLVGQQAELSEDPAAARSSRPVYKNDEELIGPPPPSRPRRRPLLPDRDVLSQRERDPSPSRIPLRFDLPTVPGDAALVVTARDGRSLWSPAEDAKLMALGERLEGNIDAITKELEGNIDAITKELPGRTVGAVRRRWYRLKYNGLDRLEENERLRQQRLAQRRVKQLACARAVALQ